MGLPSLSKADLCQGPHPPGGGMQRFLFWPFSVTASSCAVPGACTGWLAHPVFVSADSGCTAARGAKMTWFRDKRVPAVTGTNPLPDWTSRMWLVGIVANGPGSSEIESVDRG